MNPRIGSWHGRRVWLVGASAGIGAALARELSGRGARLALSARSEQGLRSLQLPGALLLPCDVGDVGSLERARDAVLQGLGGIDLTVYLAGDYQPMQADDFDLGAAERIIDVNFRGAMRLASVLLAGLEPGQGLAFVSSVAGYRGLPKALAYGPGKAALIHFAECLHLELAPRGIGIWLVNPGFVATRLTERNDFSMPALISTGEAARQMVSGFARGHFEIHFPRRFTRVMKLLSLLPYRWYFPLVRRFTRGAK